MQTHVEMAVHVGAVLNHSIVLVERATLAKFVMVTTKKITLINFFFHKDYKHYSIWVNIYFSEEVIFEVIPPSSSSDIIDLNGHEQPIDLQMPVSIHLDHLHNVYVAAGTLACALLIVIVSVSIFI